MTIGPNDIQGGPQSTLKSMLLYTVAQGLNMLVPLCTMPLFTRLIPVSEYSVRDMLGVVVIAGVGLGNWGLHGAYTRYFFAYRDDHAKQERLLGSLIGFSALCLLVVCCAGFVLRGTLAVRLVGASFWGALLVMLLVSGVCRYLLMFFLLFYRNSERAGEYVKYDLLRLFVATALSLILVVGYRMGIHAIVLSQLVAHAAVLAALAVKFGIARCLKIDWSLVKESLLFGWPLMGKVLLSILHIAIARSMIRVLVPNWTEALGVYGRANVIAYTVFLLMISVDNVYLPKYNKILFDADAGSGDRKLGHLFTEHVCVSVFPAVFLVLLSYEVITVLLPPQYFSGLPLVVLLTLYYAMLAFGQMNSRLVAYLKKTKFAMVVRFACYALLIGLNVLLIPRFHALGAVIATLVSGIVRLAVFEAVLGRRHLVAYERGNLAAMYGMLVVAAVLALCCYAGVLPYWLGLAARLALLAGFVLVWARVFGIHKLANVKDRILAAIRPSPTQQTPPDDQDSPGL